VLARQFDLLQLGIVVHGLGGDTAFRPHLYGHPQPFLILWQQNSHRLLLHVLSVHRYPDFVQPIPQQSDDVTLSLEIGGYHTLPSFN
jgi:hypothetical protein